jgi:hypothetical protein
VVGRFEVRALWKAAPMFDPGDPRNELYSRPRHFKAFISSKMADGALRAERTAAIDAVEAFPLGRPWAWEKDAPAGSYYSEEECIRQAGTSDAIVLILEDELTSTTRKEYVAAHAAGATAIPGRSRPSRALRAARQGFTEIRISRLRALGEAEPWRRRDLVLHVGGALGALVHRDQELGSILPGREVQLAIEDRERALGVFRVRSELAVEESAEALAALTRLAGDLASEGNPVGVPSTRPRRTTRPPAARVCPPRRRRSSPAPGTPRPPAASCRDHRSRSIDGSRSAAPPVSSPSSHPQP